MTQGGNEPVELPRPLEVELSANGALTGLYNSYNVGIFHWMAAPDPHVVLAIWEPNGPDLGQIRVPLGGTVEVDGATWRLQKMRSKHANQLSIILRKVEPGVPDEPPVADLFVMAELRPFGELDWDLFDSLEQQLGRPLPGAYRQWLQQNNGAQPVQPCTRKGTPFLLTPERPLLGVHPEYPPFDLMTAQRQWRDPYLPPDFIVIAVPGGAGGLLVTTDRQLQGPVMWLPPEAMTGRMDPEHRTRLLKAAGSDFWNFYGGLEPYEPPAGPPVNVIMPDDPRYQELMRPE